MRALKSFLSIMAVTGCFAVYGQTQGTPQAGTPEKAAAEQEAAPADSAASASMAMDQNAAIEGDTVSSEGDGQASNTPAVGQRTTSQSGSPAMMSESDGKGRDGTNNVQRAGINMAGSPVDDIKLDGGQAVDPNTEMRDRQDDSQEKQISAQNSADGKATGVEGDKKAESAAEQSDDGKETKKSKRKKSRS